MGGFASTKNSVRQCQSAKQISSLLSSMTTLDKPVLHKANIPVGVGVLNIAPKIQNALALILILSACFVTRKCKKFVSPFAQEGRCEEFGLDEFENVTSKACERKCAKNNQCNYASYN